MTAKGRRAGSGRKRVWKRRKEADKPVALATALLLDLLGVGIDVAGLGKVTREVLLRLGGAVGEAGVVTIVLLVGASHW